MTQFKKPHVVIVDDDEEVQNQISTFFEARSFKVSKFSDGETTLEAWVEDGNSWDVVVSDLHLPRMAGAEFTDNIHKLDPELPVIFIANPNSAETAAEMIGRGAYDFLVNPIYFPQLLISVERAMKLKTLKGDITSLREVVKTSTRSPNGIIGRSPNFLAALEIAKRVAPSNANILVTGESGTGKEVFARYIHRESPRAKGPFIAINCSAIPGALLESELFGHAKGSFTGAIEKKVGLFEEAQDGTLFLDEIGDLSPSLQAKLLRVLQEKKIRRVGENQHREINARIISATHKDLAVEIANDNFREDLFYRLSVIPLVIPPLRDRVEDIMPLAECFLKRFSLENGSPARYFSKDAVKYCLSNPWRGNVRELENAVERAVILSTKPEVCVGDFGPSLLEFISDSVSRVEKEASDEASETASGSGLNRGGGHKFDLVFDGHLPTLQDVTQKYIEFAVTFNGGAKDRTARDLGIDRKTLYKRLQV